MTDQAPSDDALIREHLQGGSTALARLWLRYDQAQVLSAYGTGYKKVRERLAGAEV